MEQKPGAVASTDQLGQIESIRLIGSESEHEAYLFICKRPGETAVYASVWASGSEQWPWDQWSTVERVPLCRTGDRVKLWPRA